MPGVSGTLIYIFMRKKFYCTAPWTGIHIAENGHVKTCCEGRIPLGDLCDSPIDRIIDNSTHQEIKQKISSGEVTENCTGCLHREEWAGESPLMNYYNESFPDINKGIQVIDLRWSNLCNLTCVYCGDKFSTSWMRRHGKKDYLEIRSKHDLDVEEWLLEQTPRSSMLLVGGEPLLMKQNQKLLSKISKDTNISIITNLAYDLESNPCYKSLTEFTKDKVQWNISLENIGEKFEWIRAGAEWSQIEKNLKVLEEGKFAESSTFIAVYGIFSALDLFETYKKMYSYNLKKITLQNVTDKPLLDLFNYPTPILSIALDQLEKILTWQKQVLHPEDYELYRIKNFNGTIAKLKTLIKNNHQGNITSELFNKEISRYDQISGRSFKDLWPDVYALIQQHC